MPIKNLKPRLAALGNIKIGHLVPVKGGDGRLRPEKLDHFIVTTMIKTERGYETDRALMHRLWHMERERHQRRIQRKLNEEEIKKLHVRTIDVMLPFEDPDENFLTTYAIYDGKGCRCRGDGEKAEFINPDNGQITEITCPCAMLQSIEQHPAHPQLTMDNTRRACKPHGLLRCMILAAETLGGVHVFRTTSWNTITALLAAMQQIKLISGGVLAHIPLQLTVRPKHVPTRNPDGTQAYRKVFVVDLTYEKSLPEFLTETAAIVSHRHAMQARIQGYDIAELPAPGYEDPDEAKLVADEYMPEEERRSDNAQNEASAEPEEPAEQDDRPYPRAVPDSEEASEKDSIKDEEPTAEKKSSFPTVSPRPDNASDEPADKDVRRRFIMIGRKKGYTDADLRRWMGELWEVESTAGLKQWQVEVMIDAMEG